MPHSLFLGSALAAQDRLSAQPKAELPMPASWPEDVEPRSLLRQATVSLGASIKDTLAPRKSDGTGTAANTHAEHQNRSLANVRAHLGHAVVDMVFSLLGFAVVINSLSVAFLCLHGGRGTDGVLLAFSSSPEPCSTTAPLVRAHRARPSSTHTT
jgi:hypothetical protein